MHQKWNSTPVSCPEGLLCCLGTGDYQNLPRLSRQVTVHLQSFTEPFATAAASAGTVRPGCCRQQSLLQNGRSLWGLDWSCTAALPATWSAVGWKLTRSWAGWMLACRSQCVEQTANCNIFTCTPCPTEEGCGWAGQLVCYPGSWLFLLDKQQ